MAPDDTTYTIERREDRYEDYASTPRALAPGQTYGSVTDDISRPVLRPGRLPRTWYITGLISLGLLTLLFAALTYLLARGVGIWGVNIPVAWGFAIINFVWWIGIGHAGTLISAILFLFRQDWRNSINRFAEAMTLFAVACAGLFPLFHLGRPWVFYWMIPYPTTLNVYPQFRSPLVWDIFAVMTYLTVSLLFWYLGLIPDLATMRDRAKRLVPKKIYAVLSWGWRGSVRHWEHYQKAYLLLAGLATPLVISVHSIVGTDFAYAAVPGWHSTIFPPYFVAGAIFSGFAMVLTLVIPVRKLYNLEHLITDRHLDYMGRIMLATGLIVGYGYIMEAFFAIWYSGSEFEAYMMINRMAGPYMQMFWAMIACNVVIPQLLWSNRVRSSATVLFVISIFVNIGMWLERYIIVVTSLHRDYMPSAWGMYQGTFWDWATYLGTIGLFLFLMVLFIRLIPMISIFEIRELVHEDEEDAHSPAATVHE